MSSNKSQMKDVFKAMNVNQPFKLSKSSAPAFTAPQQVTQKEVAHIEPPQTQITSNELPQKEEANNELPKNGVAQNMAAKYEIAKTEKPHSEKPQNRHTQTQLPKAEVSQIKVNQKELSKIELPQKEEAGIGGFFKLSHSVFADIRLRNLPGDCFRLFIWLSSRAWRFTTSDGTIRASVSFIEAETGMSHATVSRGLKVLKEMELIKLIKLDYKQGNTWWISNIACSISPTDPPKNRPQKGGVATSDRGTTSLKVSEELPQNEQQNKNIKNYKELSQEELELKQKVVATQLNNKRNKEQIALDGLLRKFTPKQILDAYNFVTLHGTLGKKEKCLYPFSYLSFTMEDVLILISKKMLPPVLRTGAFEAATSSEKDFSEIEKEEAEKRFENELNSSDQEKIITDFKTRECRYGNYPPKRVLKILAMVDWAKKHTRKHSVSCIA